MTDSDQPPALPFTDPAKVVMVFFKGVPFLPFEYEKTGSAAKGQKGTFIGIPSATHIHLVGNNDHLKIQDTTRYDINWKANADNHNKEKLAEIDRLRTAWSHLVQVGDNSPGVPACKLWLKSYLVDYHGVNASKF